MTEELEFDSRKRQNIFSSFLYSVKTDSGADPASCPVSIGVLSPGGEADNSPPPSADIMNARNPSSRRNAQLCTRIHLPSH
jgi:hypothetical protein